MRERHVSRTDALPDRLWKNVLPDDVLFIRDEQIVGDRARAGIVPAIW